MGFDNECILNIQSLPGEYFCPVCRTLVYPSEALQTQCTHLYCKPCLAYIVATTCACPYDGYLVSEADAKPLIESNKPTAEAIEKIQVHCLYHRSGCQWQGTLSECITHCTSCNFGNSPVVCNRCGTQIIHRQVQEHAQICPGVQPQAQQGSTQNQGTATQNQIAQPAVAASQEPTSQLVATSTPVAPAAAAAAPVPAAASAPTVAAAIPASGQAQSTSAAQPQSGAQVPSTEQWYQQQQLQYQQYYQQYSGYDPYQQYYQQYGYYQQQAPAQYPQAYAQPHPIQGQQQPQAYIQQQPQAQPQANLQPQLQVQASSFPQPLPSGQISQPQAPANIQQPVQAHLQQPQMHPSNQSQVPGQPLGQLQTQNTQLQPQTLPQAQPPHLQPQIRPQHQQPMTQHPPPQLQQQPPPHAQYQPQINSQPHTQLVQQPPIQVQPQQHPRPYSVPHSHQLQMQPQPQPQPQTLPQPQLQPLPQSQPQAQPQLHTAPAHAVTGHQSFPQTQFHQQAIPGAPTHQRPIHMHPPQQGSLRPQIQQPLQMHNQFPQQQPTQAQMRPPPPPQMPLQGQQQATMPTVQGAPAHLPPGPQQAHHLVHPSAQQIHHPPGMQAPLHPSIPQQQAQGSQHQQGPFPPQQPSHPQQVLRPHGLPFSHQPSQLPSATQTAPRPMVPAHTLQQQPFAQSVGGPGVSPQVSSDHKVGSVQFMHSESQSTQVASTPSMNLKAIIDENRGDYLSEKTSTASGEVLLGKSGGSSADLQVSEKSLKHEGDEEKLAEKAEGKNSHPVVNGESSAPHVDKDLSEDNMILKVESSGVPEKSPHRVSADSLDEHRDEQNITAVEAKGVDRMSNEADDRPIHGQIQKEDSTKAQVHQDAVRTMKPPAAAEKLDQNHVTQGSMYGNERGSVQSVPRHPPYPSVPPTYDLSAATTNDRNFLPGYPDRNVPQFPPPGAAPSDARPFPPPMQVQSMGPPVHHNQMQDHERFIQHVPPHAPPYMQDTMPHRPPAPERAFMQQMPYPGPNQERMFQEPQPPHSVPTHGQPLAPNQMRPPQNVPETLTHQARPAFPDPLQGLKHAPGSFPVQGPHAPLGRGPGSFGPQGPQLSGQGQMMPPPTVGTVGSRISPVEPFPGPPMMGPPSGSLATAGARNARGPPIHLEGQMPQLHPLSAEPFPGKMPGLYDGRQHDYPRSMTMEHFPQGMQPNNQPNMMSMNALSGKGPDSSQFQGRGERFKPLPEERFKSLGEEGFKTPLEDHFRPYGRAVDRRDFEEDLKQFPRPSDLDSEGGFKFENYLSSSRPPIDRNVNIMGLDGPSRPFDRGFGPEAGPKIGTSPIPSRFIPMGHSGSHLGGSSLHPMDSIERSRSHGLNDDNLGRKGDAAHPDFRKVASDFGHHHLDSFHPLRSPGRELGGFPPSRFGSFSMGHGLGGHSRLEEFGSREPNAFGERSKQHNLPPDSIAFHESRFPALPGSGFRRGEPDPIGNIPGHMRSGNLDGHETLPGHMRGDDPLASGPGSFRNNFRFGDFSGSDNVPPHMRAKDFMRFGEPGFGSGFSKHGFPNEPNALGSGPFQGSLDQLDHRKRKLVSISWCRICKIDCETVEGLDMHSQTKEHQKMAMDIVLSIKQDNAKKQKLSSEEHDEANKSRKTGFEGRPIRR